MIILILLYLTRLFLVRVLRRLCFLRAPLRLVLFLWRLMFFPATSKATMAWFHRRPLPAWLLGKVLSGGVMGLFLPTAVVFYCVVRPRPSTQRARLRGRFGTVRGEPESPPNLARSGPSRQPMAALLFLYLILPLEGTTCGSRCAPNATRYFNILTPVCGVTWIIASGFCGARGAADMVSDRRAINSIANVSL